MQSALQFAAEQLNWECRWLDLLLERQVLRLRALRDQAPDKFRGLYIADAEVDALLAAGEGPISAEQIASFTRRITTLERENALRLEQSPELPLAQIKARFGLSQFECRILMIALAPELDLRYQTLYAYVQNDVTRKAPTVDLLLKLLCADREEQWAARAAFSTNATLLRNCLLHLIEDDHERQLPLLARSLKVPERIAGFLLGHDNTDPETTGAFACVEPQTRIEDLILPSATKRMLRAAAEILKNGGLVVFEGRPGSGKLDAAGAVCAEMGLKLVVWDLARAAAPIKLGPLLRRECLIAKAGLYLRAEDSSRTAADKPALHAELVHELEGQPFPIFLGTSGERAALELPPPAKSFRFALEVPEIPVRRALWQQELNGSAAGMESDLDALAGKLRFTPGQIREVLTEARTLAHLRGNNADAVALADIYAAVRARGNPGLEKLARKCELLFHWDDLVLPERVLQQLREIANAVRFRHVVHSQWRFDTKVGKNLGLSVLFSGLSGTGKTMAASVLTRELELDLYKIDLSKVVSKYIGETEKNLGRIFDEAEHSSAVLFFDEADALFGKRSEVKDAHDRYANIEVAFLLQRMEEFSGLAILATNISRNIDAAFARRMQYVVEFPFPDAAHRERIWRGTFPPEAPLAAGVDFSFLARQFELSGGNIRNVVTAAAFLAAEKGLPISMEHLARATAREFQKMGKLPSKAEFRGHFDVIAAMVDDGRT
jgi:MoxR-like ATPase